MDNPSTALATFEPQTYGELREFCELVTKTRMVPLAYQGKPEEAMVAIMFGRETGGLGPLTSLQFIAVINGRPGYYSDAVPGIALNKGLITNIEESEEGIPFQDDYKRVCVVTKANGQKARTEFSVKDAKTAGLWDKAGPWKQYPKRMLQWRARNFAIRDGAPNMLFGASVEEMQELETALAAKDITPAQAAKPVPGAKLAKLVEQRKAAAAPAKAEPEAAAQPEHDEDGVVREYRREAVRAADMPADLRVALDRTIADTDQRLAEAAATAAQAAQPEPAPVTDDETVELVLSSKEPSLQIMASVASDRLLRAGQDKTGKGGLAWVDAVLSHNPWIAGHAPTREGIEELRATFAKAVVGK